MIKINKYLTIKIIKIIILLSKAIALIQILENIKNNNSVKLLEISIKDLQFKKMKKSRMKISIQKIVKNLKIKVLIKI